jgi:simple sugar transport system ATP-binding protein
VQHAYPVGDRFLLLNRGRSMGFFRKKEVTRDQVTNMMAGGAEMQDLEEELARIARSQPAASVVR